jgi:hypothetical protein
MKSSVKSAKPSTHLCDPKKVADTKEIQGFKAETDKIENELVNILNVLTSCCISLYSQKPLLITEELMSPPLTAEEILKRSDNYWMEHQNRVYYNFWTEGEEANCNHIDLNLVELEENHWANRAISEVIRTGKSTLALNGKELFDFVKRAKGTVGAFTTDIGDSLKDFFMYISFKNNAEIHC